MNDSIGGVTVELLDDFRFVDPSFAKGETVTLKGEQALRYVRERGALEDSSNLRRMERQQQYIGALLEQYIADGETHSTEDVMKTVLDIREYMVSDYTADQLSRLFERLTSYRCEGIFSIAGESVIGTDGYMEYHADDADIRDKVVQFFYLPEKVRES